MNIVGEPHPSTRLFSKRACAFALGLLLASLGVRSAWAIAPGVPTDPEERRLLGKRIFTRLAGVPPTSAQAQALEAALISPTGGIEAAASIALGTAGFINNTIKLFGSPLLNKAHALGPMNDGIAMMMCNARANRDWRDILITPNTCRIDPSRVQTLISNGYSIDIQSMENFDHLYRGHYSSAESNRLDFNDLLVEVPRTARAMAGWRLGPIPHTYPDYTIPSADSLAGVLTSKAFKEETTLGGTNRAWVSLAFESFTCRKLSDARDSVFGRDPEIISHIMADVPRSDPNFYVTCSSCHGGLDALASGLAYHNYHPDSMSDGISQNPITIYPYNESEEIGEGRKAYPGPASPLWAVGMPYPAFKNRRNLRLGGYMPVDSHWKNFFNKGANQAYFGWRGPLEGDNVRELGRMISNSRAFSRCTVTKTFEQVCRRSPASSETALIESLTDQFEGSLNYRIRALFGKVSAVRGCLGD